MTRDVRLFLLYSFRVYTETTVPFTLKVQLLSTPVSTEHGVEISWPDRMSIHVTETILQSFQKFIALNILQYIFRYASCFTVEGHCCIKLCIRKLTYCGIFLTKSYV